MSIVNKPYTFSPNTTAASSQVNANFDTLYNDYNGGISAANLATDAVTTAKIADSNVTTAKIADGAVTAAKLANVDGWTLASDTWTYASATTFTIAGVDRTSSFPVGTKIKLTQTTTKYFYVVATSFSTDTTVTITGGSSYTLANAAITSPYYSYASTPQAFPHWFNYAPTPTGFSANPSGATYRFAIHGRMCTTDVYMPNNGTSNATTFTIPAPVTAGASAAYAYTIARAFNNGGIINEGAQVNIGPAGTAFTLYTGFGDQAWTNTNAKGASFLINYEI